MRCCSRQMKTRWPRHCRFCAHHSIAVVPFGGGTSVVGGLDPVRGDFEAVVSLDLRRAERAARSRRGVRRGRARCRRHGPAKPSDCSASTASPSGHFPQSFQFATIGGFAATRSSGQDSAGYGRFDDMVRGLRVVTPAGMLDLGRAPASAAGPDLRQLIVGSEGVFGVITRVRVRVHRSRSHPLRGVVVPRLRHRRRRVARGRADRHRTRP